MVQQLPPTRDVNQEDRDDLLIPLASGVQELLFAPVNPFNDRPGFVAGPRPETGLAGAVQDVTRLNCRLWASRDKSAYSPRVNGYNGEVCGPYLDSLGENPGGGSIGPPFRGGQCLGVAYDADFTYTNDQGSRQTFGFDFPGGGLVGTYIGAQQPNQLYPIGVERLLNGSVVRLNVASVADSNGGNPAIENIRRQDQLPDTCGDPPTEVQPPGTVTPTTPIAPTINIDLPGVGPVTINVDLDADGNVVITAPDVDAEVTVAPTLDIDLGGGGGGGGDPGDPTDPGTPGTPEGTGQGGDAEGVAPEGTELVGLLVTVAESTGDANRFANNSKQPFRGIGYVRMGFPGRLGLDISGGTVISPQFFHAQQRGLTAWAVAANVGFNLTVQPYFRNIET